MLYSFVVYFNNDRLELTLALFPLLNIICSVFLNLMVCHFFRPALLTFLEFSAVFWLCARDSMTIALVRNVTYLYTILCRETTDLRYTKALKMDCSIDNERSRMSDKNESRSSNKVCHTNCVIR